MSPMMSTQGRTEQQLVQVPGLQRRQVSRSLSTVAAQWFVRLYRMEPQGRGR